MTTNPNGIRAFQALEQFLMDNHWNVEPIENYCAFKGTYRGKIGNLTCYFQVWPDLEQFLFYMVPDFQAPMGRLQLVAEYIARVNSGMRIGNFEVDFRDGQIRFKSSLNFSGEDLTCKLIGGAIGPALEAVNTYLPGLVSVIEGRLTPVRAINSIDYSD